MKLHTTYLEGAVLPTVVVAALVMLTATLGLLALWEQETLLFTRTQRLRQARADVESAALLYRLHPDERALTAAGGYLLYDSLPQSRIFVRREPWGLYELLHITTADSLVASSRIVGAEPDPARTLFYADDRTAVTLAGDTRLHGTLRLPQNGLTYGRVGAEFYRGEEVPRTAIRSSAAMLPAPSAAVAARIGALFAFAQQLPAGRRSARQPRHIVPRSDRRPAPRHGRDRRLHAARADRARSRRAAHRLRLPAGKRIGLRTQDHGRQRSPASRRSSSPATRSS